MHAGGHTKPRTQERAGRLALSAHVHTRQALTFPRAHVCLRNAL